MAKKSKAARAIYDDKKKVLEADLAKYQALVRELRTSNESKLVKTHKQKQYHKKILDLKSQLEKIGK